MFEQRAKGPEILDDPNCDPNHAAACYRTMALVNRYFGGTAIVRRYINRELDHEPRAPVLRILDIGSGSCDIPLAVSRWARSRGRQLHFTCLETADHAMRIGRDRLRQSGDPAVRLIQEDVFAHQPAEPYDGAIASLCLHHFDDDRILELVRRLRGMVRRSFLINDLRRSRIACLGILALTAFSPAGARHDGLQSIRRGFRVNELQELFKNLDDISVSVERAWFCRIQATIRFTGGT